MYQKRKGVYKKAFGMGIIMEDWFFSLRVRVRDLEAENKKLRFENSCLKIDNDKYSRILRQYENIIPEQITMGL